jgi:hypothetical protein
MTQRKQSKKGAFTSIATFTASAGLLITVCFAPVMAQQNTEALHDTTNSKSHIAISYLA